MITFKKYFESHDNNQKVVAWHVTSRNNLKKIRKLGLRPNIPEDFGESGDAMGVYCFPSKEDAENALYNWMGERIAEWEEQTGIPYNEVLLKLDITNLPFTKEPDLDWEIIVREAIPPDRILAVEDI